VQVAHWNKTDQATTVVADIQTGNWDSVNRKFEAGCSNDPDPTIFTNAVKVTTHRVDTPLFLMQVLGGSPKLSRPQAWLPCSGGGLKGPFPVTMTKKFVKFGGQLRIFLNSDTNLTPLNPLTLLLTLGRGLMVSAGLILIRLSREC